MRKNKMKFFIDLAVTWYCFFLLSCADTKCVPRHQRNEDSGTRLATMMHRRLKWKAWIYTAKLNEVWFFIEDPLRNPVIIFFAREVIISARLEGLQRKKINSVFRKKRMWIVYYLPPNPFSYLFVLFLEPSFAKNCLTSDLTKYLFLPSMNTSRGVSSFLNCCRPLRNF